MVSGWGGGRGEGSVFFQDFLPRSAKGRRETKRFSKSRNRKRNEFLNCGTVTIRVHALTYSDCLAAV